MTGWIIYSREDVEKNKSYINMYVEKFKKFHVDIKTIIVQEISEVEELITKDRPCFAINRSRNSDFARRLEVGGIRVFNSSKVTEIANDKAVTYEFLKNLVPFMPIYYKEKEITSIIENKGFLYPLVVKSCGGHGGSQVYMVNNDEEYKAALDKLKGQKYVVQQCCSDLGKDVRVYVIGEKIIAAMLRTSTESFKSNYSLGGNAQQYELNKEEREMVFKIMKKLPMDYAGIDFTFHNGKAVFNEIEDAVGARMLYAKTNIDIVGLFVEYMIETLKSAGKIDVAEA